MDTSKKPVIDIQACDNEISAAEARIGSHDYESAIRHLETAHLICHESKKKHLTIHKLFARIGWLQRSPGLFFSHTGLLLAAWLFD